MGVINSIIGYLVGFADWFWGIPILILIGGGGVYITLRIGFLQITKFPYICSQTFGKMLKKPENPNEVSPFSAAMAALASSIGASNIVGVPVAIALGGPGAIFWMWVLALIGCGTKFAEIVLGVEYREKDSKGEYVGGPFYYIQKGFAKNKMEGLGKFLGLWFAFWLMVEIIPSIGAQSASAIDNLSTLNVHPYVGAGIIFVIVLIVAIGGFKTLVKVTDNLVPIMACVYILGALVVIFVNAAAIPAVIVSIFQGAFTGTAAVGGFAGAGTAMALRWGAARGVYSNEAGMGTSPIAHATANTDHPVRQGLWGVFEVTVDTLIVCTITALCVLSTGMWKDAGINSKNIGAVPSMAFRSIFGVAGDVVVTICVFLFVLSTIIVIVFYGQRQAEFLFGEKFANIWKFVYVAAVLAGAGIFGDLSVLYSLTDFFLALVIIPNMIAVIMMASDVAAKVKEFFNTPGKYYMADMEDKKARKI